MQKRYKKALIIGCGISGPAMALFLQRIGIASEIYEAKADLPDDAGIFLGLSPNGLNVIKELIPLEGILEESTPGKMLFFNAKNKNIGELDTAGQQLLFGAQSVQLKRSTLNRVLRTAAIESGITIVYNKKLSAINQAENSVTATFSDGSQTTADFLIGADGIHSMTRNIIFPHAPKISYTGLLSTGGFTSLPDAKKLYGAIRMTFGQKSFFAYSVSNKGEVWWFNNITRTVEPKRNKLNEMEQVALKNLLLAMHKNDPSPITDIIKLASIVEIYPIYDIPFLDFWHNKNVCLIGDAAHATAPHIGQGASLALEDTMMLAKCIRDASNIQNAFAAFQSSRQYRVQKIIKQARKVGNSKTSPNSVQQFFRDLLLPFFIKQEAKKMNWVYGYKIDW